MATATLTNAPTVLHLFESVTGVNGAPDTLNPDIKKQGSNSVEGAMTVNGNNDVDVDNFTAADLSSVHIRQWFNISFVSYLSATNPIQVYISDGTNTAYYAWDGGTSYAGGWAQIVTYTGATPTSGTKPTGNTTAVGIRFVTSSKPRNVPANCWFDAWYYGDGYEVSGGTSGDEIDLSHVAALDAIEAYGVVERVNDVYFFAGDVTFNGSTYFKSGQKVQFKDLAVSSTLYGVTFAGASCNIEINGGAWGAAGTQDYVFDASDTALNAFDLSGVQFEKANSVLFASGQTIDSVVFNLCGQIDPSTATFTNIQIKNTTDASGGVLYPNTDTNISDLRITSDGTGYGLKLVENGTGTRTFDNIVFIGFGANDTANAMVGYTGTSSFDLAYSGGTEPTVDETSTGIVTVLQNQVTATITGQIATGFMVIYDDNAADPQELGTELKRFNSVGASETYTYPASKAADDVVIHHYKAGYKQKILTVTLLANDFPIDMTPEIETN